MTMPNPNKIILYYTYNQRKNWSNSFYNFKYYYNNNYYIIITNNE